MALLLLVSIWIWNALIQRSPVLSVAQQVIIFSTAQRYWFIFLHFLPPFWCLSRQLVVSRPTTVLCVTNCNAVCDCGNSFTLIIPSPWETVLSVSFLFPSLSGHLKDLSLSLSLHTCSLSSQQLVSTHLWPTRLSLLTIIFYRSLATCYCFFCGSIISLSHPGGYSWKRVIVKTLSVLTLTWGRLCVICSRGRGRSYSCVCYHCNWPGEPNLLTDRFSLRNYEFLSISSPLLHQNRCLICLVRIT